MLARDSKGADDEDEERFFVCPDEVDLNGGQTWRIFNFISTRDAREEVAVLEAIMMIYSTQKISNSIHSVGN